MISCKQIMTNDLDFCVYTTPVDQVAKLMKACKIGVVPIVESLVGKEVVGIITDRDLVIRVMSEGRDPRTTQVEEVMTPNVIACPEDADTEQALSLMEEHMLRRLPIVNRDGQLVGIISESDVATRLAQPEKTAHLVGAISRTRRQ